MTLNELVQRRMFLLTVLLFVFIGYFGGISNVGINKTVGWAWDITSWLYFIRVYFIPIFIIGYGILALMKYSTHRNLSIFHLILITLTLILDDMVSLTLSIVIILNLISLLTFLTNFIWSIRNRNSKLK
ncbi:hypothetical protein [Psychroserpens sp. S379A]|uniref:hypothetical protein n=1 Tax=Psychroserpens sp. S379A TaxID=3415137 RepID=UPI003C79B3DD